jgi:EAL domain-containing protein (putative c-di-GMP-specific phosphodiesterase class I)/GGDEF domain-containing protein
MKQFLLSQKSFVAAVLFYCVGIVVYSCFEFFHTRAASVQQIDNELLKTVGFAENILRNSLRDNLIGEKPITPDEDYFLSIRLQELATQMDVAYVYSMIKRDNTVFFIASNPLPAENNRQDYHSFYMTPYEEAPATVFTAFELNSVQFAEYEDRWGRFRSVFFPLRDPQQRSYVIGVDVNIDKVIAVAWQSLYKAVLYGLFLGVMIFPLLVIYLCKMKQHYARQLLATQMHALTDLPNQRRLEQLLVDAQKDQLLLIEVENFDQITAELGVAAVDALIVKFAYQLTELVVPGIEYCQWFHLADNRFALYTCHDFSDAEIREIVAAIYRSLTSPGIVSHDRQQVPVVVRMAAISYHTNPLTLAAMALTYAKQTNQSFVVYESSLNLPAYYRRYIDVFNQLAEALKYKRVRVFMQPIVDISSGEVAKYEALARIYNESGDIISSPDEFMPIAYQSRLCHKLTRVMLDKVIEAIGSSEHIVSMNLSIKDLFDSQTRNHIIRRARESNVGSQLEFELLEQQKISNYRLAGAYIKQLKSCVSQIGMDDLGKLYSNFDRLLALPLDFVKIDGMVIDAIGRDSDARSIVEGIVAFARQKNMRVIAECCSSQSVCDMVALMGVDLIQGFYVGMPTESFAVIPEADMAYR